MARRIIAAFIGIIVAVTFGYFFFPQEENTVPEITATSTQPVATSTTNTVAPAIEIVGRNFAIPWDIAFLPGDEFLVTERGGEITRVTKDRTAVAIEYNGARHVGEGGLLGMVLHPDFATNKFLYLYMTTLGQGRTVNRVERYVFENDKLTNKKLIIDNIPGAIYHDGGRMEFGPDGKIYITTGDATTAKIAQDKSSLGGKILRLNDDGSIPADNPFGTPVYSYGHRNPQGLAWDAAGNLWETEHGRSGVVTGMDELNLIQKGANYGWPDIEGDETQPGMTSPVRHSGASKTWAPASLAYLNGSLFFGGLRGEALYEAKIQGTQVVEFKEHFFKEYGRIRTVRVGPDGLLYITTSNRDDRGTPKAGDDKIIRINPTKL